MYIFFLCFYTNDYCGIFLCYFFIRMKYVYVDQVNILKKVPD